MNADLKNILVVLDRDADPEPVLAKAARIAAGSGAALRLFCCGHEPRLTARLLLSPDALSAARSAWLRSRRDWLEALAGPLRDAGHAVEVESAWDAPLHAGILAEVALCRPDLVVKEAEWHESIMRRLLSHADWRLMQGCPVPVLLTRATAWGHPPQVAAAVDPGHPGDPAAVLDHAILSLAGRLAGWIDAVASVVHAYQPMDRAMLAPAAGGMPLASPAGAQGADMRVEAAAAVAELLTGHRYGEDAMQLIEGAALDVLPAWCAQRGLDVLVVGLVSRSRLAEAVIGSTAERLLDRVPSDLLVLHGPQP